MVSELAFVKMHGAGNDFVLLDGRSPLPLPESELAIRMCDRHYGIGADGLIVLAPSSRADFRMLFFNPDGTRDVCGNGMRCAARLAHEWNPRAHLSLETDSGIVDVEVFESGARCRVRMGRPSPVVERTFAVDGSERAFAQLNTGTPHAVTFVASVASVDVARIGALAEHAPVFGEPVSVDFVEVVDRTRISIRIWERSVGETLACGTGACAAVVASFGRHYVDSPVEVASPGGVLTVEYDADSNELFLTGPAAEVFRGFYLLHANIS